MLVPGEFQMRNCTAGDCNQRLHNTDKSCLIYSLSSLLSCSGLPRKIQTNIDNCMENLFLTLYFRSTG